MVKTQPHLSAGQPSVTLLPMKNSLLTLRFDNGMREPVFLENTAVTSRYGGLSLYL